MFRVTPPGCLATVTTKLISHALARARTTARETTATAASAAAAAAAAAAACSGEARARWHVVTHVLGMPLRVSRHARWSDARSLLRVRVRIGLVGLG